METCRARPSGSPFQMPAELAAGLDPESDPRERLPAPVSPVLSLRRGVWFPRAPVQEGTGASAIDLVSVLHDTTVMQARRKAIPQGPKHWELPRPQ
jgi:hypothetical protein